MILSVNYYFSYVQKTLDRVENRVETSPEIEILYMDDQKIEWTF